MVSVLYDLIWMIKNEQSGFIRLLTIMLFLLKVCDKAYRTYLCALNAAY